MSKRTSASPGASARGLFDPDGVFWRVNRESVLLVGGGAALLMQVAHPKIAAGVTDHSEFRERPVRRLYSTIRAMQDLIYGDRETALETAASIRRIHARVNGELKEGTAMFPVGTRYSAEDPELVVWVFGTLIYTMLQTYALLVRPLSRAEERAFYKESKLIAELFGATDAVIPSTIDDFYSYFEQMIEGPILEITPTARAVAEDIIHPPITGVPDALGDLASIPAFALLPEALRERYGFKWDRKRDFSWRLARRALREALVLAPSFARVNSGARRAEKRARLRPPD